jgi:hypothetical protein
VPEENSFDRDRRPTITRASEDCTLRRMRMRSGRPTARITRTIARACRPAARRALAYLKKNAHKASPGRANKIGCGRQCCAGSQRQVGGGPPRECLRRHRQCPWPDLPEPLHHQCRRGRRCFCFAAPALPIIGPFAMLCRCAAVGSSNACVKTGRHSRLSLGQSSARTHHRDVSLPGTATRSMLGATG